MVSVYNEYNMVQESILEDMVKDKIAYRTDTYKRCKRVLQRIKNDVVHHSTRKWLEAGVSKYKYVIFEFDEWVGFNSLDNIYEDKRIVTTVVDGKFVDVLETKWIDRKLKEIKLC